MNRIQRRLSFRPYSFLVPSIQASAVGFLVLLCPHVAMLAVTRSYASLLIVLLTALASVASDALYSLFVRQYASSWLSALVHGLIIGLLLPATYSPAAAFVITLVSLLLAKYAFGGFTSSWINPAAVTVAACYLLNMAAFPFFEADASALGMRNAALSLIQDGTVRMIPADSAVTAFLNRTVFRPFSLAIPEGYVSLFWDTGSLIPAFRFNLITIVSSIILIALEMVDWLIPLCFMLTYCLLVRLCGPLITGAPPLQGDMLLALLTSGTLFSTLYLLQWYGTVPVTAPGKIVYGVLAGIAAFLIVGLGTSGAGYVFTVLTMNVFSPLIQSAEDVLVERGMRKSLLPRLAALQEEAHA